ncbi:MAG: hypothetical protein WC374_13430 [Phycisphaerae bacterium]|jgi:hypothetical protein
MSEKKWRYDMEEFLQQKVNEIAAALSVEFPQIAENDPAEIGRMAKQIVLDMAEIAVHVVKG